MVAAGSRDEQVRNQQARRDVATIRGDLNRLGSALGTTDPGHAGLILRNLVAAVRDLETRVAALEAKTPSA